MKRSLITRLLVLTLALFSVTLSKSFAQDSTLTVIATTTILADIARNIGGDMLTVESLLPADADTHAYEPTIDDAARLASADMLLVVGIGYEEFLGGLLELAGTDIPVIEVSNGLEIITGEHHEEADVNDTDAMATAEANDDPDAGEEEHATAEIIGIYGSAELECGHDEDEDEAAFKPTAYRFADHGTSTDEPDGLQADEDDHEEHGACDPHVWMNPLNIITWANNIADAFAAADPTNADAYRENAAGYAAQLEALDLDVNEMLGDIPPERRVLVTNHDFMGYYAAHYGFEVAATVLPGSQTGAEPDPQALAELITFVQSEGVPAIFAEVSANPQLAQLIADEAGIAVVSTLYSESLSAADGDAPTYLEFIRTNTRIIAEALR